MKEKIENQFLPDYPKTIGGTIELLQEMHDETAQKQWPDDYDNGFGFGLITAIKILEDLARNTAKSIENYKSLLKTKNESIQHVLDCIDRAEDPDNDWNWETLGAVIYQHREMYRKAMANFIDDSAVSPE